MNTTVVRGNKIIHWQSAVYAPGWAEIFPVFEAVWSIAFGIVAMILVGIGWAYGGGREFLVGGFACGLISMALVLAAANLVARSRNLDHLWAFITEDTVGWTCIERFKVREKEWRFDQVVSIEAPKGEDSNWYLRCVDGVYALPSHIHDVTDFAAALKARHPILTWAP